MADAGQLSFRNVKDAKLAIISPNDPGAMVSYAEECRTLKIPFIFDPGQQCSRMSGDELKDGIAGAHILICNDYEFELIRQKTEMGEREVLDQVDLLIITKGEKGSTVITKQGHIDVPAVTPHRIADPTGVGDAFRGGLMKGFAMGLSPEDAAKIGSVAATYCLEHLGGTYHSYTWGEFEQRYRQHFGVLTA
jgi:adenosine kinase